MGGDTGECLRFVLRADEAVEAEAREFDVRIELGDLIDGVHPDLAVSAVLQEGIIRPVARERKVHRQPRVALPAATPRERGEEKERGERERERVSVRERDRDRERDREREKETEKEKERERRC